MPIRVRVRFLIANLLMFISSYQVLVSIRLSGRAKLVKLHSSMIYHKNHLVNKIYLCNSYFFISTSTKYLYHEQSMIMQLKVQQYHLIAVQPQFHSISNIYILTLLLLFKTGQKTSKKQVSFHSRFNSTHQHHEIFQKQVFFCFSFIIFNNNTSKYNKSLYYTK